MRCQNCNIEVGKGVQICYNCGATIVNNLQNNESQSSLQTSLNDEVNIVEKKRVNLKAILLIIALLLVVLLVVFLFFRKKTENGVNYLMKIDDVFGITGKGIAVVGRVENGVVSTGDIVNVIDFDDKIVITTMIVEIQLDDLSQTEKVVEVVDKAKKGDSVVMILGNINREYYKVGYKIVESSSLDINSLNDSNIKNTEKYDKDGSFLMDIEEVINNDNSISANGTISRGTINLNDVIQVVGLDYDPILSSVAEIKVNNQNMNSASAGDVVSILLKDDNVNFVAGQTLAEPNSIEVTKKFEATIYMLSKEEGGRHTAIYNFYRPMFRFRTNKNSGVINFLGDIEMINPGDKNVQIEVELTSSMALEVGMEFSFYEGGRTVGKGTITKIN